MSEYIRLLDRDGNPCLVKVEELIAIKPTADGPEFHTKDNLYYYPTTLEELLVILKEQGFERLDRTNLVNLNHIKAFDKKARKVYFDSPHSKDSKFATVSEANISKVEHLANEEQSAYRAFPKPSMLWNK
ncbi:LytTR family DNA-binding domain-containing protein [Cohnella yongneupensis]|uniref:LytTR family DNA-binding domain-containing protein n=1 Tax=Cohnella yongneupensis TaxID=425006 RepID=A0ABW0R2T9_9BACL